MITHSADRSNLPEEEVGIMFSFSVSAGMEIEFFDLLNSYTGAGRGLKENYSFRM